MLVLHFDSSFRNVEPDFDGLGGSKVMTGLVTLYTHIDHIFLRTDVYHIYYNVMSDHYVTDFMIDSYCQNIVSVPGEVFDYYAISR